MNWSSIGQVKNLFQFQSSSRIFISTAKKSFYNRNVVQTLENRGMLEDVFPRESVHKLVKQLKSGKPSVIYAGFDPTAPSLHVGNLLVVTSLLHFHRAGHKVVLLLGGATARIGDPSGKNSDREMLGDDEINKNISGIRENLQRVVDNHNKYFWSSSRGSLPDIEIVDNSDWYMKMNIIDFLSSVGRNLRMGRMLGRTSVKSRIESEVGLSLTEFTYQAFQAFDWLHLLQTRGCNIQIGGKDQLGNIVAGQEMISKELHKDVWGLTIPLIVNEEGDKFGKSAGAPVWLDSNLTSPFNLYQFMMRLPDSQMSDMLKYFTFLIPEDIEDIMDMHLEQPEMRRAQTHLAKNVTLLVHGQDGLDMAEKTTNILYKKDLDTLAKLSSNEAQEIFSGAPYVQRLFSPGLTVLEMANKIGCFRTEKDAIRIIRAGGFSINMVKIDNTEEVLTHGKHIMGNGLTLVRVGKKNYYIVEWT